MELALSIFIGTLVRPSFRQLINFDLATLRVLPSAIVSVVRTSVPRRMRVRTQPSPRR